MHTIKTNKHVASLWSDLKIGNSKVMVKAVEMFICFKPHTIKHS